MVATRRVPPTETLHVDSFGLSFGSVSVGLPRACTADVVLLRYLDLVRLVGRAGRLADYVLPPDDIRALAGATNLDETVVRHRLDRLRDRSG